MRVVCYRKTLFFFVFSAFFNASRFFLFFWPADGISWGSGWDRWMWSGALRGRGARIDEETVPLGRRRTSSLRMSRRNHRPGTTQTPLDTCFIHTK